MPYSSKPIGQTYSNSSMKPEDPLSGALGPKDRNATNGNKIMLTCLLAVEWPPTVYSVCHYCSIFQIDNSKLQFTDIMQSRHSVDVNMTVDHSE